MQIPRLLTQKKGNAMQHPLVLFILGFFAVGFLSAIYVIILGALYGSITKTADGGANWTAVEKVQQGVINSTLDLFENFTGQFGTIGTVGGILVLLVLLAAVGIGGYAAYRKYR